MNLYSIPMFSSQTSFIQETLRDSLSTVLQKKMGAIVLLAFAALTACFLVYSLCFMDKKAKRLSKQDDQDDRKEVEGVDKTQDVAKEKIPSIPSVNEVILQKVKDAIPQVKSLLEELTPLNSQLESLKEQINSAKSLQELETLKERAEAIDARAVNIRLEISKTYIDVNKQHLEDNCKGVEEQRLTEVLNSNNAFFSSLSNLKNEIEEMGKKYRELRDRYYSARGVFDARETATISARGVLRTTLVGNIGILKMQIIPQLQGNLYKFSQTFLTHLSDFLMNIDVTKQSADTELSLIQQIVMQFKDNLSTGRLTEASVKASDEDLSSTEEKVKVLRAVFERF